MTEPVLQQREIDQLVRAVRQGEVETGPRSLARLHRARPLDFRKADWSSERIIRRRLPVLDLVFDRLVPALQITLTKSLRFPVRAEGGRVELRKFGDFRAELPDHATLFEVMRLDPLRGSSVLVLDASILYALIDALMGGLGIAEPPEGRDISDIEIGLIASVTHDLMRDLENAWRPWFPLRVEHIRSDRHTQLVSTLPDQEVCHVGKIVVTADVLPATPIYVVMPYTSLEPLHEAISARVGEDLDPNWRANLEQNLRAATVDVTALLGRAELPAARIRALAEGDVISLDREAGEDLEILVEGQGVFRGRLGKSHDQYALRITEQRKIQNRIVDRTLGQVLVRKGLISREQLAVAQVDELLNRRGLLDSVVGRGWVERRVLEHAISSG